MSLVRFYLRLCAYIPMYRCYICERCAEDRVVVIWHADFSKLQQQNWNPKSVCHRMNNNKYSLAWKGNEYVWQRLCRIDAFKQSLFVRMHAVVDGFTKHWHRRVVVAFWCWTKMLEEDLRSRTTPSVWILSRGENASPVTVATPIRWKCTSAPQLCSARLLNQINWEK